MEISWSWKALETNTYIKSSGQACCRKAHFLLTTSLVIALRFGAKLS